MLTLLPLSVYLWRDKRYVIYVAEQTTQPDAPNWHQSGQFLNSTAILCQFAQTYLEAGCFRVQSAPAG